MHVGEDACSKRGEDRPLSHPHAALPTTLPTLPPCPCAVIFNYIFVICVSLFVSTWDGLGEKKLLKIKEGHRIEFN